MGKEGPSEERQRGKTTGREELEREDDEGWEVDDEGRMRLGRVDS